jgi:uncharacterized membrane protein
VLPLCGGLIGALLAQFALWLDDGTVHVKVLWHYSASTATGVLTAIIGAMVALLGFVVTVGVLVIQQATGSLSPRFMRLWYRDRLQKIVIATFAGTFTYSFALLRRIEANFVPDLGITLAGLAVAVALILLLVYLDRFTHTLRPVAVAALVESAGERVLAQWQSTMAVKDTDSHPEALGSFGPNAGLPVLFERAGAIQAIHVSGLLAIAAQHDCAHSPTHRRRLRSARRNTG